ncbi:MAG TPA: tRNA pseudouridine(55) synthase TruB [Acidimicrobiales bacterium]
MHGLLVVDKPAGLTSHDVVDRCRRALGERRVGHSGTLDPDATGVLLVGVGSLTRVLRFLTELPKRYTGEVVLGVETSTLDAAGEVTARHAMAPPDMSLVREVVAQHLTGPIMQVPPMVSALKVDGRRLHELAREGVEVERAPRPVTVHSFSVEVTGDPMVLAIDVTCSSGTYVRTLAADLGRLLGGGAHLRRLRREAIGSFDAAHAVSLEDVGPDVLLAPVTALRDYARVDVDEALAGLVRHGRVLDRSDAFAGDGPWAVVGPGDDLLAVYEKMGQGAVKPAVVLSGA